MKKTTKRTHKFLPRLSLYTDKKEEKEKTSRPGRGGGDCTDVEDQERNKGGHKQVNSSKNDTSMKAK